jgi:ABC-type branched-subunit amino acid transport system ATPase component
LRAAYGKKEILRGVDFVIGRGETVTLLGANGSGKSTCLNTISGFLRPTGGEIVLKGIRLPGSPFTASSEPGSYNCRRTATCSWILRLRITFAWAP